MKRIKLLRWVLPLLLVLAAAGKPAAPAGQAPSKKPKVPAAYQTPLELCAQEPTNAAAPGDFTMVLLPDTQFYTAAMSGGRPEMFTAQTDWIISNRVSRNIAYVTLLGDISNDGNRVVKQWRNATNALYRLEDPVRTGLPDGIPYGVAVGNHDTYGGGTERFNEYFGTNHFAGHRYYGGHYGTNNDSHFDLFSAGGQAFIVLSLTMAAGQNADLMRWANEVLRAHVHRRAIVVSHSLLSPALWPTPAPWTKEGPAIFDALAGNPNVFLMLCGHRTSESRRHEAVGASGRHVDVLLSDFQSYPNGGNGFLVLLEFSPARQQIRAKTFSPCTGEWATNSAAGFTLDFPSQR